MKLFIPMQLPAPHDNGNPLAHGRRIKAQRMLVRVSLDNAGAPGPLMRPPPLPAVVTLTRVSSGTCDTDRAIGSLAAVRDEVARWLGGLPFATVEMRKGRLREVTPRAPDGPNDPITWRYGQQKTPKAIRPQGVIIEIGAP